VHWCLVLSPLVEAYLPYVETAIHAFAPWPVVDQDDCAAVVRVDTPAIRYEAARTPPSTTGYGCAF